ncbi:MAG: hypothetical protein DMG14_19375 [Acidobacteria bacterium]|nr:MAG: hypothetical protein DMG14_19375 [Acidobacteriota bacterium]
MAKDRMLSVIISANAEWEAVKRAYPAAQVERSPYGEYFKTYLEEYPGLFFHGGWGKVRGIQLRRVLGGNYTTAALGSRETLSP